MNELARMQYLDALGIDTFIPRLILPAAKVSVQCELPVVTSDELTASNEVMHRLDAAAQFADENGNDTSRSSFASELPVAAGAFVKSFLEPAASKSASKNLRSNTKTLSDVVVAPTLKSLIDSKHQSDQKALRFQLNFWHQPNGLSVLDTREPKAALPTTALLANIYAIFSPNVHVPRADLLQWPLIESPVPNPSEWQDARDLTQAFLASRCSNSPARLMLILGDTAMQMVGQTDRVPDYGAVITISGMPTPAIFLPSLAQLLKEPALKRFIWPAVTQFGL